MCTSNRWIALILAVCFSPDLFSQAELSAEYGTGNSPVLSFYQNTISEARGVSCPMYPSCSQYAKLAFKQYNGFRAVVLTADRLMRCGHDLRQYESIPLNTGSFYYDVLPNADIQKSYFQTFYKPVKDDSTFVDFLISKRRFQEARVELWREIYETKDALITPKLYLTIGKTFFINKEYDELVKFYSENSSAFASSAYNDSIKILLTKSYLYNGRYQAAQVSINSLKQGVDKNNEVAFLQGLVSIYQHDMIRCEAEMKSISSDSKYYTWAKSFDGVSKDFMALKRKSPKTASFMSVFIPGSGYLVAGKRGTALTALVINSLFAFIAVEAFRNDNLALGIGTSVIGSGWYVGSIIGSYNSTVKWNNTQEENFIKQKTLPINLN